MDMTDITEFDCVKVGDFAALNAVAALQTHLYEDRVMKVGRVDVGKGVTVGAGSTVLYDTHIGDFARLGPLTVVMKGESIPAHSEWVGAPAEPAAARSDEATATGSNGNDYLFSPMQNMARGISSIVTTAVAAGAIGFAAGVYLVPKENANQFRAIVRDGLSAIFRIVRSDKANPDTHLLGSPQKTAPAETSSKKSQADVSGGSRPRVDAKCDPRDSACRDGLPGDAAVPQATSDGKVAVPSNSSPEHQDDQPSHALEAGPSGTLQPNSPPTLKNNVATPVAPKIHKKTPAKKVKP
jgi:hypothetical protein